MRRASAALLAIAACCPAADPADLPVSAVTLFSSGVGCFEHAGTVQGDATAELRFRTGQINDVLKSLVLQDLDGGSIGAVGYPSQDPLDKTLKSFQVDLSGNPALAQLLNQLRGARVAVQILDASLDGTVLGCESRTRVLPQNGGSETVWTLNLLTDGAIRPLALADVRSVKPADPALAAELGKALAAFASARDQDKKPVSLSFRGQGARKVRLSYVAESPVWKASYRLLLGKDLKATNLLGWAIVENPTESDWNDVRLTLVSGRPISFVQNLYSPLYASRPEVAMDLQPGLRPVAYGGGLREQQEERKVAAVGDRAGNMAMKARALAPAAPAPAMAMVADAAAGVADKPFDAMASMRIATESAAAVGELFTYTVGKVSIPRQRSAMIPIIGGPLQCERVSIYNRAVQVRNPLAGARLTNSTGNSLAAGPVTVYDDGTYAGDAQLTQLPPGQVRLVSFAVDQRLVVDSEREREEEVRTLVKIVRGAIEIQVASFQGRTYAADNQGDVDKQLVIEHPRAGGEWKLVDTAAPLETTDGLYRFKVAVPAQKKVEFAVTERWVHSEAIGLIDAGSDQIALWLNSKDLKPALKEALGKIRVLSDQVGNASRAREEAQAQIRGIAEDQERIRRNVGTVDRNSDYAKRLMTKLNDQETKLDQLRAQDENLRADIEAKRKALADFVNALSVE